MCVCVCVFEFDDMVKTGRGSSSVCVCFVRERERKSKRCVCVCVCVIERQRLEEDQQCFNKETHLSGKFVLGICLYCNTLCTTNKCHLETDKRKREGKNWCTKRKNFHYVH